MATSIRRTTTIARTVNLSVVSKHQSGGEYPDLLTDLFTAYFCARKNKRNTVTQVRFERNLSDNIMRLNDEIVSGRYRVGRSMCFIIRDPVLREVFAAHMNEVLTAEYNPYRILSVLQSYAGYQRHFHNEW